MLTCRVCGATLKPGDVITIELRNEGKDVCFCSWEHVDLHAVFAAKHPPSYIFPIHPTRQ